MFSPVLGGSSASETPVFLLKTKSTPTDAYEDIFSTPQAGRSAFEPLFVPVLEHKFEEHGMVEFSGIIQNRQVSTGLTAKYGGLVFTSQRAVEAFAKLVEEGSPTVEGGWPHLQGTPVYSVGPATTRALQAIPQVPPLDVLGEHTGNGESLAHFILHDYGRRYRDRSTLPPLLFPVGEQRRDVIPKTLMSSHLPPGQRIRVDELVVYGTAVKESFVPDLTARLKETAGRRLRWVVLFSPTGCESTLRALGMLDETGKARKTHTPYGRTLIAAIGPTTRGFLKKSFGLEPDVCADKPSPEGVWGAITAYQTVAPAPPEP